jgi:hypothetical protein
MPKRSAPAYGYLSEGARKLVSEVDAAAEIDGVSVSLSELPEGLTLLYDYGIDAEASQS